MPIHTAKAMAHADLPSEIDAVVVGAGQAGISVSYSLKRLGIAHIVYERDRAFSAWRKRWDGFRTNTPNWMNTLPVLAAGRFPSNDPGSFATRDEMVDYLDDVLTAVDPPLIGGTEVRTITNLNPEFWAVETDQGTLRARGVVLCNGAMSMAHLPLVASRVNDAVPQMHAGSYLNPEQIETSSVLVVGSGSSGIQICGLLSSSGRFESVHLSVSDVLVLPNHILGVQTHRFLHALGLFDVTSTSLLGRFMYSGLETRGDPIRKPAPKDLARERGVRLYKKLIEAEGSKLHFADGQCLSTDDLTVIWCTGFRGDYRLLAGREQILDARGVPLHKRGVALRAAGLYFVGLRHQHTIASHDIYGVANDASYVADQIKDRLETLASHKTIGPSGTISVKKYRS